MANIVLKLIADAVFDRTLTRLRGRAVGAEKEDEITVSPQKQGARKADSLQCGKNFVKFFTIFFHHPFPPAPATA